MKKPRKYIGTCEVFVLQKVSITGRFLEDIQLLGFFNRIK